MILRFHMVIMHPLQHNYRWLNFTILVFKIKIALQKDDEKGGCSRYGGAVGGETVSGYS